MNGSVPSGFNNTMGWSFGRDDASTRSDAAEGGGLAQANSIREKWAAGERGLMQVSEIAAKEWAKETRVTDFRAEDLFDPKTNLEAGACTFIGRCNAGSGSRILRCSLWRNTMPGRAEPYAGPVAIPRSFPRMHFERTSIFPARKYVDSVIQRYEFYKRRGRM
jgi:soluble lytic murein transglycosylase